MRVAYFTNHYPKVSHSFIRREILALERQGIEVFRFAVRGWDGELVDREDFEELSRTTYLLIRGVLGLLGPTLKIFFSNLRGFLSAVKKTVILGYRADRAFLIHWIYLMEACALFHELRSRDIDHVHGHFGTNSAEVLTLVHALGGPEYSFTVHGPEEFDKPASLKLREKIQDAKFVVAISSYGKSQLYRILSHHYWSKVKQVHCGLESGFYDVQVNPVEDNNRLLCVGRLCEQKGQLLLLEAARQLKKKNISFELVFAGDGELRSEIESLVQQYDLINEIKITGWISSEQVRDELLKSRAMVLPSFAEGLPVVIMEAMSLKRPVLTTYIAGIPELVLAGETGWLFPAGSIADLTDAIEQCLNTPVDLLRKMGEKSHERVLQRHHIDTEASKLSRHFQKSYNS